MRKAPGRAALYEAGREVISELGYNSATVDHIVSRAGLTKGAFYHHWASKDQLLRDIQLSVIDVQCALAERFAAQPGPVLPRLREFISLLFQSVVEYQAEVKIFHGSIDTLNDPFFADVLDRNRKFQASIRQMIDEGVARGELRTVEQMDVPGWLIGGSCGYAFRWWPLPGNRDPAQVGAVVADLLVGGLAVG